jgi:hypothetical protein
MKRKTIFLTLFGYFLIVISVILYLGALMASDPEIEGEASVPTLSEYITSLIPGVVGLLIIIVAYKRDKK